MKEILFLSLAAAAFASCSQDEILDVIAPEAITFNQAFVNNATRAIDNFTQTSANLPSFKVWGTTQGDENSAPIVPIFAGVEVSATRTESNTTWEYSDNYTQYWIDGNQYNFAAVYGATEGGVTITNGIPSKIAYDATTQTDLLYAEQKDVEGQATGSNSKVAFTFSHLLSKVFFTVKNTITTNVVGNLYQYRVSNIRFTNAYLNGDFNVTGVTVNNTTNNVVNGTWDLSNAKVVEFSNMKNSVDQEPIVVGKVGEVEEKTSHYARLVIPAVYGESNKLNIACTVETLLNGSVVDVDNYSENIAHTFVAGHAYNFIISKNVPGDKIEFTVTSVEDWNNPATDVTTPPTPSNNED